MQSIISISNTFAQLANPSVAVIVTEVNASSADVTTVIFPSIEPIETPVAAVIVYDDTVHALFDDVVSPVRLDDAEPPN